MKGSKREKEKGASLSGWEEERNKFISEWTEQDVGVEEGRERDKQ